MTTHSFVSEGTLRNARLFVRHPLLSLVLVSFSSFAAYKVMEARSVEDHARIQKLEDNSVKTTELKQDLDYIKRELDSLRKDIKDENNRVDQLLLRRK
jgi:peptidoglycan hydrolase CwlO-like protein